MEGSIVFYTYGSTLELYGQQFTAGMLTADLLNLSPDEYRPMSKRMKQVTGLKCGLKLVLLLILRLSKQLFLMLCLLFGCTAHK